MGNLREFKGTGGKIGPFQCRVICGTYATFIGAYIVGLALAVQGGTYETLISDPLLVTFAVAYILIAANWVLHVCGYCELLKCTNNGLILGSTAVLGAVVFAGFPFEIWVELVVLAAILFAAVRGLQRSVCFEDGGPVVKV